SGAGTRTKARPFTSVKSPFLRLTGGRYTSLDWSRAARAAEWLVGHRRPRRIVIERQQARRVHIGELVVIDGPEERRDGAREQHERQRNHDEQHVHAAGTSNVVTPSRSVPIGAALSAWRSRRSIARPMRIAFSTTTSELTDMPSAARSGGTKPSAASGTAAMLYVNAHR